MINPKLVVVYHQVIIGQSKSLLTSDVGLNWALHCYLNSVVGEGSVEKGLQLGTSELKVYNCFLILKL